MKKTPKQKCINLEEEKEKTKANRVKDVVVVINEEECVEVDTTR